MSYCSISDIITIFKNRNKTIRATITGPGDLTGALIWFTIKNQVTDSDNDAVLLKRSSNNGGSDSEAMVTDGPNGIIEIYISPADTVNLSEAEYWFDIVIETASGIKMQAVDPRIMKIKQPVTVA